MTLIQYAKSKGIDINICGVKGKVAKEDEKELKKLIDELASGKAVMETIPLKAKPMTGVTVHQAALHRLGMNLRNDTQEKQFEVTKPWWAATCPNDTDGDGNCGRIACPYCGVNRDRTP